MRNLVVRISLDNAGFINGIQGSQRAIEAFSRGAVRANRPLQRAAEATATWTDKLRDAVLIVGLARHALLNLNAVFTSLPHAIVRANADLERMEALMRGLSTSTKGAAAIQEEAAESMKAVFSIAKTSPFDITAISDSFVKLKAGGIDPLDGSLQAVVDSVAKFGGTSDVMKRASVAIQQMAGKGVISMEELRQQLGEAVPNSMQIMARSLGVSVSYLAKIVSTGTLSAKEALAAMMKQMALENSGAAEEMSKTWDGQMNKIRTQLIETAKVIGDTGFYDSMKDGLAGISEALDTREFKEAMTTFGNGLTTIVGLFKAGAVFVYNYGTAIMAATAALAAGRVVHAVQASSMVEGTIAMKARVGAVNILTAATNAYNASISQQNALLAAGRIGAQYQAMLAASAGNVRVAGIQSAIANSTQDASRFKAAWAGAASGAAAAFRGLGSAVKSLGTGLLGLVGGPIGLAVIAIGSLAYKLYDAKKEAEGLRGMLRDGDFSFVSESQREGMQEYVKDMQDLEVDIGTVFLKMKEAERAWKSGSGADAGNLKILQKYQKEYEKLQEKQKEMIANRGGGKGMAEVQGILNDDDIRKSLSKMETAAARGVSELVNRMRTETAPELAKITEEASALFEANGDARGGREEAIKQAEEKYAKLKEIRLKYFDDDIARLLEHNKQIGNARDKDSQAQLAVNTETIEQLKDLRKAEEETFLKRGKLVTNANSQSEALKFLQKVQKALTSVDAAADDVHPLSAAFKAMEKPLEGTAAELAKITSELEKLDKAFALNKEKEKEDTRVSEISDRLNGMTASIKNTFNTISKENPFMKNTQKADEFITKLGQIRTEIQAMSTDLYDGSQSKEGIAALASIAEMEKLSKAQAAAADVSSYSQQADDIRTKLLPTHEALRKTYDMEIQQIAAVASANWKNAELVAAANDLMIAKTEEYFRATERPLQTLAREWADTTVNMEQAWARTMQNFSSMLTEGIMTGKFQLKDFANSFVAMMIEMKIQQQMAGFMGAGGGLDKAGSWFTSLFANGGVMTGRGAMQLQTYANGGIANRPQVAVYGEGRQPEAYVPLPDGRSIPVTMKSDSKGNQQSGGVTVNVINESGQPVSAQSSEPRFDGKQMIYDIVLEGMNRAGGFRDGMKGAMRR